MRKSAVWRPAISSGRPACSPASARCRDCGQWRRRLKAAKAISSVSAPSSRSCSAQFGRRSERLDPDQFELALEDIDSDIELVRDRHPATRLL
ncbi:transposase [Mesorhizobium sp. M1217]|uniref:transposase n=1 Tax=Mesorhizobium sp. M1217 TaxID=2957070 RepID=UPI00333E1785